MFDDAGGQLVYGETEENGDSPDPDATNYEGFVRSFWSRSFVSLK